MYDFQEYAYAGNMLYPDSTECQRLETSPYAAVNLYSKKSDKPTENAYLDRMKQWNPAAFRKAEEKVFGGRYLSRVMGKTVEEIDEFLSIYNGYSCKLVKASENKGYDGYYYTYLEWEKN